ncbi:SsrA-binding protein SmpB [Eubacteriales bacterium OttesenSCG-928-N13]|nr:SsrA-binding protein SmpB [Eubacteriales bacterium OttesenSCG-928-N13]
MPRKKGINTIALNRKARHDYFIEEAFEAGIELKGTEVKSIRMGQVNLKECFAQVRNGQLFIEGMHISPYDKGNIHNTDPLRAKRLLMHKSEIRKLDQAVMQKGLALIPLSLYLKDGRVKVEVAICRGKKMFDKRDDLKKRDAQREVERHFAGRD